MVPKTFEPLRFDCSKYSQCSMKESKWKWDTVIVTMKTTFAIPCLSFVHLVHFDNVSTLKWKERCSCFPFRVNPFQKESKNDFNRIASPKLCPIPLFEPRRNISCNISCAPSEDSDQADQSLCCPPEDALELWLPIGCPAKTDQTAFMRTGPEVIKRFL